MNNQRFIPGIAFLFLFLTACSGPVSSEDLDSSVVEPSTPVTPVEYERVPYQNPATIRRQDGSSYFVTTADPDVILGEDGYYYMYPTNAECEMGSKGITFDLGPIFRSTNLSEWIWVGSVFDGVSNAINWGTPNAGVWAPSVVKIGDTYNYYYSLSTWGDANPGIGVATSPTPYGPWTHYGKVLDSVDSGVRNSIDPIVFIDNDVPYLIWGSFFGIACVQLTDDGIEPFYGSQMKEHLIWIIPKAYEGDQMNIDCNYEGSYIIKRGDYYYFFGSQGTCCSGTSSTYRVKVGRSTSLFGPYLSSTGVDLSEDPYGDLVIAPSDDVAGVGHNSVIQDFAGDYWLVYHGFDFDGERPNERVLFIDKLLWDENEMPYVANKQASTGLQEGPMVIKRGDNL